MFCVHFSQSCGDVTDHQVPVARQQLLSNIQQTDAASESDAVSELSRENARLSATVDQLHADNSQLTQQLAQLSVDHMNDGLAEDRENLVAELTNDRERLSRELASVKTSLSAADSKSQRSVCNFYSVVFT